MIPVLRPHPPPIAGVDMEQHAAKKAVQRVRTKRPLTRGRGAHHPPDLPQILLVIVVSQGYSRL